MHINRDNYEDCFLLYVDGELCAADKKAVEDFAAANSDLQKELEMLKATVIPADLTEFTGKSYLYKTSIVDEILQESLLLKIDNELPENELASLNILIATDAAAANEFRSLQRTKFDPAEKVIFEDRHLLYRKEKDNVVIGRFIWRAAAAVLIGIGSFLGISYLRKDTGAEVKTATVQAPVIKKNSVPVPVRLPAATTVAVVKPLQITQKKQNSISPNAVPAPVTILVKNNKKDDQLIKKETPDDQLVQQPIPVLQKKNGNNLPEPIKMNNEPKDQLAVMQPKRTMTALDNNIVPLENGYAQTASLKEDKSDNKILYMDEDDVKRSKAGGLFRKVKRFMERTAKIKTGTGLRIAGFQLAAK